MVERSPALAILPRSARYLDEAVTAGGGRLVDVEEANALVWTHNDAPDDLAAVLDEHPGIGWVQLPWAGVDTYLPVIRAEEQRVWTSAKGIYAPPVAELGLALLLAVQRGLHDYARATTWTETGGTRLHGRRVTVLGGGGIARSFVDLIAPFDCDVTVLRRTEKPFEGASRVLTVDRLHEVLPETDVLLLALPLLDENRRIIGEDELALLPAGAVIVNVARGPHIDTDALVAALDSGHLGGAGLDVTDPEPLPDGHPLWTARNVLISPHTANPTRMAAPLLGALVTENTRRWIAGEDLTSVIDPERGY